MTLGSIRSGVVEQPPRVLIYGVEAVGKSTFAANAPAPVFLCAEDGIGHLDVARFPAPECWQDALDAVRTLETEKHEYKTLAIDSVDWLEPLCWRHICARDRKADIEDYGYGKGYVAALDEWRVLLAALERLQATRGIGVILIGHAIVKTWKNPVGEDFDRYTLKLHDKAAGLLKEWARTVLFAEFETLTVTDRQKRVKGVDTGARIVHTVHSAMYDAKNRDSLPDRLPLSWEDFAAAMAAKAPARAQELRDAIGGLLDRCGDPELASKVAEAVAKAKDDAAQLARIENRLAAKAAQKGGVS